jgi:hypothetical protein
MNRLRTLLAEEGLVKTAAETQVKLDLKTNRITFTMREEIEPEDSLFETIEDLKWAAEKLSAKSKKLTDMLSSSSLFQKYHASWKAVVEKGQLVAKAELVVILTKDPGWSEDEIKADLAEYLPADLARKIASRGIRASKQQTFGRKFITRYELPTKGGTIMAFGKDREMEYRGEPSGNYFEFFSRVQPGTETLTEDWNVMFSEDYLRGSQMVKLLEKYGVPSRDLKKAIEAYQEGLEPSDKGLRPVSR